MVHAAVYGARGYLGRTLIQLLVDHPSVDTISPVSTTAAGRPYGSEVPSLGHLDQLTFVEPGAGEATQADVYFLATDSDQAEATMAELAASTEIDLLIDLSRAHRSTALDGGPWSYVLEELDGALPADTPLVANPGCYPTATLLALGPALLGGLAGSGALVVDGKSGVSGAGATPRVDLHFPEANESLRAYNIEEHDHEAEIQAATEALDPTSDKLTVRFTPHLVPQTRGLLSTAYLPLKEGTTQEDVEALYGKVYAEEPFIQVVDEPDTAHVKGSNRAQVAALVDQDAGLLVARGAIDNLVKGGAGNAVQTMNQALGLAPDAGLPKAGVAP